MGRADDITNGTVVRVTMTVDYLIPAYDRNTEETIKEWFYENKYPLGSHHAYRNGSKIGFSERVLNHETMTWGEYTKVVDKEKEDDSVHATGERR